MNTPEITINGNNSTVKLGILGRIKNKLRSILNKSNHKLYHNIFQYNPNAIIIIDYITKDIEYLNPAAEKIFYDKFGKYGFNNPIKCYNLLYPNTIGSGNGSCNFNENSQDNFICKYEYKINKHTYILTGNFFQIPGKKGRKIMHRMTDITENIKKEKEILKQQNIYEIILQSTNHGICYCDLDGNVKIANNAFIKTFQNTGDQILYKKIWEFASNSTIAQQLNTNSQTDFEIKFKNIINNLDQNGNNKFETKIMINNHILNILIDWDYVYHENKLIGLVFHFTNITNQKNYESKLQQLCELTKIEKEKANKEKEKADQANKAKSTFLANISHEIRTPLHTILSLSEEFESQESKNFTTKGKEYLGYIKSSSYILHQLIEDLLDLSKIEADKLNIKYEYFDIRDLIFKITEIFKLKILNKKLNFILDFDETIPTYIYFDNLRLTQILNNLLSNAIKFTDQGNISLSIQSNGIDKITEELNLKIYINDTGCGIFAEDMKRIFNTFEYNKNYKGNGLGLVISKKLIELMEGIITINSQINQGTNFKIEFYGIKFKNYLNEEQIQLENINFKNILFKPATILVVDDEQTNHIVVESKLANQKNITIIKAYNGLEALEIIKQLYKEINLILMDKLMNIMDGLVATEEIRKDPNPEINSLPVIMFSASAMEDSKHEINKLCNGFLLKPMNSNLFFQTLAKYIKYDFINNEIISDNGQKPNKPITENKIFDFEYLKRNFHDNLENIMNFLKIFNNEIGNNINTIKNNFQNGDLEGINKILHSLKGKSGTIGAPEIYDLVCHLHYIIKKEGFTPDGENLINKLEIASHKFQEEATKVINNI